jgi:hypothetical protein
MARSHEDETRMHVTTAARMTSFDMALPLDISFNV